MLPAMHKSQSPRTRPTGFAALLAICVTILVLGSFSKRNVQPAAIDWTIRPDSIIHLFHESAREPVHPTVLSDNGTSIGDFLSWHFDRNTTIPFVTLVDGLYIEAAHNFDVKLREIGLSNPAIMLCADEACMDYARKHSLYAYGNYLRESTLQVDASNFEGQEHAARTGELPRMKFTALRDLVEQGWSSVWFEGDIYLTGDPFEYMLGPDDAWDVQFGYDGMTRINFGWMFSRPTAAAKRFWRKCYKEWEARPQEWDQVIVHDAMVPMVSSGLNEYGEMFEEKDGKDLKIWVLDWSRFYSHHLMSGRHWLPDREPILQHLTAIWAKLRAPLARELGFFSNINSYYSEPPASLLTTPILAGSTEEIEQAARILFAIGRLTNRTIWSPREVYSEDHHRRFIEVFPVGALIEQVSLVEASYFDNAKRYVSKTRIEEENNYRLSLTAPKSLTNLLEIVGNNTAYSISLEDWGMSDYMKWNLSALYTEETAQVLEMEVCRSWWMDLIWRPRYWCSPTSDGKHFI